MAVEIHARGISTPRLAPPPAASVAHLVDALTEQDAAVLRTLLTQDGGALVPPSRAALMRVLVLRDTAALCKDLSKLSWARGEHPAVPGGLLCGGAGRQEGFVSADALIDAKALCEALRNNGLVVLELQLGAYRQLLSLRNTSEALAPEGDALAYKRGLTLLKDLQQHLGAILAALDARVSQVTPAQQALIAALRAQAVTMYQALVALLALELDGTKADAKAALQKAKEAVFGIKVEKKSAVLTAGSTNLAAVREVQCIAIVQALRKLASFEPAMVKLKEFLGKTIYTSQALDKAASYIRLREHALGQHRGALAPADGESYIDTTPYLPHLLDAMIELNSAPEAEAGADADAGEGQRQQQQPPPLAPQEEERRAIASRLASWVDIVDEEHGGEGGDQGRRAQAAAWRMEGYRRLARGQVALVTVTGEKPAGGQPATSQRPSLQRRARAASGAPANRRRHRRPCTLKASGTAIARDTLGRSRVPLPVSPPVWHGASALPRAVAPVLPCKARVGEGSDQAVGPTGHPSMTFGRPSPHDCDRSHTRPATCPCTAEQGLLPPSGSGERTGGVTSGGEVYLSADIGLPSAKSLMQIQAERILKLQQMAAEATAGRNAGVAHPIQWYLVVRPSHLAQFTSFLASHGHFGLDARQVTLVPHTVAPPNLTENLSVVMASPEKVSRSQAGSGEVFLALRRHNTLAAMARAGVTAVEMQCVEDNLPSISLEPGFIGYCHTCRHDSAAKVLDTDCIAMESVFNGYAHLGGPMVLPSLQSLAPATGTYYFTVDYLRHIERTLVSHPMLNYRLVPGSHTVKGAVANGYRMERRVSDFVLPGSQAQQQGLRPTVSAAERSRHTLDPTTAGPDGISGPVGVGLALARTPLVWGAPVTDRGQRARSRGGSRSAAHSCATPPSGGTPLAQRPSQRPRRDHACAQPAGAAADVEGSQPEPRVSRLCPAGMCVKAAWVRLSALVVVRAPTDFSVVWGVAPFLEPEAPSTAVDDLLLQHTNWVESAGAIVGPDPELSVVEVSPLVSFEGEGLEFVEGREFNSSYEPDLQGLAPGAASRTTAGPWIGPFALIYVAAAAVKLVLPRK
ncbi:MAG: hypothetical protein WDW38_011186 [Sanguina aurantia]